MIIAKVGVEGSNPFARSNIAELYQPVMATASAHANIIHVIARAIAEAAALPPLRLAIATAVLVANVLVSRLGNY